MIDLNNYLTDLCKNILFFDSLISFHGYKKEDFLQENQISPRTFRRLKNNPTSSSKEVIEILNKYFNINEVCASKVDIYAQAINEIIKNIYYKLVYNHDYYIDLLNNFIEDNNLLQPVFKVFKMILVMSNGKLSRNTVINQINDDLKYTIHFTKYFDESIKMFHEYCYIYYENINKINLNEVLKNINYDNYASALVTNLISGKYYAEKKYSLALVYAFECEKILLLTENYNRLNCEYKLYTGT